MVKTLKLAIAEVETLPDGRQKNIFGKLIDHASEFGRDPFWDALATR